MKLPDGLGQIVLGKIRPQPVDEHHLGIGALPQQKIADALFAAGADDQIGIGQSGGEQMARRSDVSSIDRPDRARPGRDLLGDLPGGGRDFVAPAIAQRHRHDEPGIVARQVFGVFDQRHDLGRQALALTDDANAHALAMEFGHFAAQIDLEQPHQLVDLGLGPPPVLRREAE